MAVDKESLKKMFPNLYRELEEGNNKVSIDAVRKHPEEAEDGEGCGCDEPVEETTDAGTETPDKLRHFYPQAVDFIRRCDTETQAEEIVTYMQKRGELTKEQASEILAQLKKEGLRSFGCKKEDGYYFKQSGLC